MPRLLIGLAVIAVSIALYLAADRYFWSANRKTMSEVRSAIGTADGTSAKQVVSESKPYLDESARKGAINIPQLRDKLLPGATRANELRALHEETQAIADGKVTTRPDNRISPKLVTWQWAIPIYGPTRITVSDYVCSESTCAYQADPDGIPKPASLNDRALTLDSAPWLSAIGGWNCKADTCTGYKFIGRSRVVGCDPAERGVWSLNVNDQPIASEKGNNEGAFRFWTEPAPGSVCQ